MMVQANISSLQSSPFVLNSPSSHPSLRQLLNFSAGKAERRKLRFSCRSSREQEGEYLLDAPVSVGDGFSFSGGKYSDEPSPSDEWFKKGKMVKAHPVNGIGKKAKDPIFGLTMGAGSQASSDVFRWFCVESGNADNPSVILIHGFPSQAYSYRKALPVLSKEYHAIAFDWLGFGFSDKPQPGYGFDYTLDEYVLALESLIGQLVRDKVSLVVQGYFAPIVVKYASNHQEKLNDLILLNPPTYTKEMRMILSNENWKVRTTVCWGQRDNWLGYDGVDDFCKHSSHKVVELAMAGHHVQEDSGEELGQLITSILSKP
ncbi:PREDICTED: uncharacterized protein LOC104598304 isoform X2 [Nelumbo nucifera]|uniref:Uncharacterized protein LOC104598304 isoform X2 n=1 Tax=Nelumbo nucifera TaxID=4432 RepID=A0A1U7ZVX6_NELNU|nr:PREDICTED: uncharacterized protein LOC104598304 isoform X2 [Nelumbo nucifera]